MILLRLIDRGIVDEFVMAKYIGISIGMSIVYANSDPHSYSVTIQ